MRRRGGAGDAGGRPRRRAGDRKRSAAAAPRDSRGERRRQAWLALCVLAALLCVAYSNVIFDGRSLVYSNSLNPLDYRFLPQNYGPDFEPRAAWESRNLLLMVNYHDPGGPVWQWEPDAQFLRRGLLAGELPWWNPYIGMGTPEMANLTATVAFPPYLAMVALGNTVGLRTAYELLVVLLAGCFTFLFLLRHGLSPLDCVIGGAAFMFCGAVTQNVGSFEGQATACIPFTLYLTRCFLDRPSALMGAGLALGFAVAALASFPPILVAGFGLTALYAVVAVALTPGGVGTAARGRLLAGFVLASLAAVGLVGFYYLPALELDHAAPQVARVYGTAGLLTIKPVTLLQFISPVLMGAREVLLHPAMGEPDAPHLSYAGWVPLLLCALALRPPDRRKRALWLASWIAIVLVLMKLLGLPPVQWLAYLPVLKHIHFAFYLGPVVDLLVAFLAVLGVAQLRRGGIGYRAAAAASLAGLAVLLGTRWIAARAGALGREGAAQWESEWWLLLGIVVVWATAVLVAVGRCRRSRSTQAVAAALIGLFACEAFIHTFYPRPKAFDVWRHPPDYVRALTRAAGYGRVFALESFPSNAGGAFGVFQLDSTMAFNAPRAFELYRAYVEHTGGILFMNAPRLVPPEGVLDRAAVEFVVVARTSSEPMAEAGRRGYALLYEDGLVRIFRRRGSPHFFFSSDVEVVPGAQALVRIAELPPGRTVVLETAPTFVPAPNLPGDPAVMVTAFGRNHCRLRVDAPRAGLVYAADSLMPGWSARVNGRPTEILPANYAFRAVAVPAGRSEVELSYWPPGLTLGLVVTLASALALGGVVAWPAVRKRLRAPLVLAAASPAARAPEAATEPEAQAMP